MPSLKLKVDLEEIGGMHYASEQTVAVDEFGWQEYQLNTGVTDQAIPFNTTTGINSFDFVLLHSDQAISWHQLASDTTIPLDANRVHVLNGTGLTQILLTNASGSVANIKAAIAGPAGALSGAGSATAALAATAADLGYINVKAHYGATGDGVTDDTSNIQSALNAVTSSLNTVFFPPGTYIVTGASLNMLSNTRIIGAGRHCSLLKSTDADIFILYINGKSNVTIEETGFTGSARTFYSGFSPLPSVNPTTGISVYSQDSTNIVIRNCFFEDGRSDYADDNSEQVLIDGCEFIADYPTAGGGSGFGGHAQIHLEGTSHVKILNNYFKETATTRILQYQYSLLVHEGISALDTPALPEATDYEIANNTWEGFDSIGGATALIGINGGSFHHNTIIGNDNTDGAGSNSNHGAILLNRDLSGGVSYGSRNLTVDHNYIDTCTNGISGFDSLFSLASSIGDDSAIIIAENVIRNCSRPIWFWSTGGFDHVDFVGNLIFDTPSLSSGSPHGIPIALRSPSYVSVNRNFISGSVRHGISISTVDLSVASTGLKVDDNILENISDATQQDYGIYIEGTAADLITNSSFSRNQIYTVPNNGMQFTYVDDSQIIGNIVVDSGVTTAGNTAGINLTTSNRNKISDGLSISSVAATNQGYGVRIASGNDNIIDGVNVWQNRLGGISDAGTRTVKRNNKFSSAGGLQGKAVLVAGAVTVSTAEVVTADNIRLTNVLAGGTPGFLRVGTIVNATSFVIQSSDGADTSTVFWEIVH